MTRGYDRPLYILAFDHRTSYERKLFGLEGAPTADDKQRLAEGKEIILDGLLAAADAAPAGTVGALVDEENGAHAARGVKGNGLVLAMAAEKSSVPEFDFEFGEDFAAHIEAFEPDFVKILARYNPDGDGEMNRRQAARLARLSDWLAPRSTRYLFELLVPPETEQLASVESDTERFADELRPDLVVRAIGESSRPPAWSRMCGRSRGSTRPMTTAVWRPPRAPAGATAWAAWCSAPAPTRRRQRHVLGEEAERLRAVGGVTGGRPKAEGGRHERGRQRDGDDAGAAADVGCSRHGRDATGGGRGPHQGQHRSFRPVI